MRSTQHRNFKRISLWRVRHLCVVLRTLTLWAGAARAETISPRQAGFHQCALIYNRTPRGPAERTPYVARTENGKAKEWLFDAFLFLDDTAPRAIVPLTGPTIRSDWQWQLDTRFAPNRDLAALDSALAKAAADPRPPPADRENLLAIPYLNLNVHDFGDVDGDGKSEDLATQAGREAVLRWYTAEAERRVTCGFGCAALRGGPC